MFLYRESYRVSAYAVDPAWSELAGSLGVAWGELVVETFELCVEVFLVQIFGTPIRVAALSVRAVWSTALFLY